MQRSASVLASDVTPDLHAKARYLGDYGKELHFLLGLPEQFEARERMGRWVRLHENLVEMFRESVQELDAEGRS